NGRYLQARRGHRNARGGNVGSAAREQAWNARALAAAARTPRHRVWSYRIPAVILGCAQRAWHDDVQRRLGTRVEVLLRESGGGTVLVGPWLVGTSVVVPHDHPWVRTGVVASYRHLADLHVDALTALGVDGRAMRPEEVAAANNA